MGEGEGGLNREGELINFPPLKRGGLLERGGLIEDLRYLDLCTSVIVYFVFTFSFISTKKRGELSQILLVFSVTPFKIDQNKNQNRPIDKVQNLRN